MSKIPISKKNRLEFRNWNFGFVWDLGIGIWDFKMMGIPKKLEEQQYNKRSFRWKEDDSIYRGKVIKERRG